MSVQTRLERLQRFERERALLHMRSAVVAAIAPAHIEQVGSAGVLEAVDEALAQIVASGAHLDEPERVRALWITCARRRIIDDQRSAWIKHRGAGRVDDAEGVFAELANPTEDGRQRWRIHEIFSVLRGDQRRWAEAWYDEVLSSTRPGQPRGLPEALGWTPAKTKSVSRRARIKMAKFIEARASGAVCEEQRAQMDALITAGAAGDERYAAVLFHVAGCEDCWAAWRARRRELLGRGSAIALVPFDAVASALQACATKLVGLAAGAQVQAASVLARLGIGGAAAAGGGAAALGNKSAAVCVGVVCAAAAGGEVAMVLSPRTPEQPLPSTHEQLVPSRYEALRPMPARAWPVRRAEPAPVSTVPRAKRNVAPATARATPAGFTTQVRESSAGPAFVVQTPADRSGGVSAAPAEPPPFVATPSRDTCAARDFEC